MATVTKGYTFGTTEEVTAAKLHSLVDSATVTSIVNADINSAAAITDSRLAQITTDNKVHMSAIVEDAEAQGDLLIHNGTRYARVATGTADQMLVTDGTDPSWSKADLTANVTGTLPSANGGTGSTLIGWVVFDGTTNTAGKCTIGSSLGVTDVDDNGTGDYTINWSTSFDSVNYVVAGTAKYTGQHLVVALSSTGPLTAGTARIIVASAASDTTLVDSTVVTVFAIGNR